MGGIMKAVFKGAHNSKNRMFGDLIAILPGNNNISEYADIKIVKQEVAKIL